MALIRFDEDTGKVSFSPEAKHMAFVKVFLNKDKTKGQVYVNKALVYVYHVYSKSHDLSYLPKESRKKRVVNQYLEGYEYSKFDNDKRLQPVIEEFIREQYTQNELFYESLKEDFKSLKEMISKIPWTRKVKFEKNIEVEVDIGEGKKETRTVFVKKMVEVSNAEEKITAIKHSKDLISLEEALRKKIMDETREKKTEYLSLMQEEKLG